MFLHRFVGLILLVCCLPFASAAPAQPTLGDYFGRIEAGVDAVVRAVVDRDFAQATSVARELLEVTTELHEAEQLPVGADNANWQYYSSNLYHHSQELIIAIDEQDSVAVFYLLSTILDHVGELQATVPLWLREHLFNLMALLKQGLINHDTRLIRDTAEEVHVSSTKLLMSATSRRSAYRHTRWTGTISAINRLGDEMIPMSERGHWEKIDENADEIEVLLLRWSDSFVNAAGVE